jgi:hypothetical protein
MDPLTMAAISAGATAAKAGLQAIPTKFERDQKKRLKELQRKQEMGLLGLTEAERAQIESQLRAPREQAQRRSDAEIARLSTPTAQSGQQLLAAQLGAEGRQRMEADLASQLLGMDIQRQREQEADIAAMEAGQGLKQDEMRASLAAIPMAGAEAYIGQMGLEQLINVSNMTPEQRNTYLKNDLQLDDTETSLLQLDEVVDPRIVPTSQQVDGLFPQGKEMPQLLSTTQNVADPRITPTTQQIQQPLIQPIAKQLPQVPKSIVDRNESSVKYVRNTLNNPNITPDEAFGILNLLQHYENTGQREALNLTLEEVANIYFNMPTGTYTDRQYNQSMNIPSDQVSMINETAFPALSGRMNVTDRRGQEI